MVVLGHVLNGVVVPDDPIALPEGVPVRLELLTESPGAELATAPRTGGIWRGKITIADDFDELPSDIAAAFGIISP